MEEMHARYFLKISGRISELKKREFEQTIRFVFNQLPQDCKERELIRDSKFGEHCTISFRWVHESVLLKFMESEEFLLIIGAYSALGDINMVEHGIVNKQEIPDSNSLNSKL